MNPTSRTTPPSLVSAADRPYAAEGTRQLQARPVPSRPTAWWPEVAVALVLAITAVREIERVGWYSPYSLKWSLLQIAVVTVSGGAFRRAPALALVLAWSTVAVQVVLGSAISLAPVVMVLIAFGAARYGRPVTLWAAGASVLLSAWFAVEYVRDAEWRWETLPFVVRSVVSAVAESAATGPLAVLVAVVLLVPWGAGLVLRSRDAGRVMVAESLRAVAERDVAQTQRSQAEELAALRDGQARLARDVHDVVGHSLAVVIAQAESVQYLPEDDPAALRATVASIASSARTSLADVREVLSAMDGGPSAGAVPRGTLDTLVEDVRSAGTSVVDTSTGTCRPLPPDLETAAYRVLQEMLTNALKHGRRGEPVLVSRDWADNLTITVQNAADRQVSSPFDDAEGAESAESAEDSAVQTASRSTQGLGIDGIRRRLEHLGGTFSLVRTGSDTSSAADDPARAREGAEDAAHHQATWVTATAIVPLRGTLRPSTATMPAGEDPA